MGASVRTRDIEGKKHHGIASLSAIRPHSGTTVWSYLCACVSKISTWHLSHHPAIGAERYHDFLQIKIRRVTEDAYLPQYAHGPEEDAGMDLRATAGAVLEPNVPQAIPTGLSIELPAGYEAQLRPRSGLA